MFELAMPLVLLALPLPWLIWYLVPRAKSPSFAALRVPFFSGLSEWMQAHPVTKADVRKMPLLFIIWSLLLLALAGPRWIGEPQPLKREGYNILLALDISGSMEVADRILHGQAASRLAVVKEAAEDFVKHRTGDRIGLILFGTRAYLQTPLTYDRQNVLLRIEDATPGLAGTTTSIGDAIGLAVKRLREVPAKGRIIILLTDGVNNSGLFSPQKAAELAREEHIKIYTIGLGADKNAQMRSSLFFSMNPTAELDEDTLKAVADMTGGQYFAASDFQSLQAIYQHINQMESVSTEQATVRPQKEYYPVVLGFALLLFFYWMLKMAGLFKRLVIPAFREVSKK